MPGGLGTLWEMSRRGVSTHGGPGGAGLLGNRTEKGVGQQTECALREIVCPGDVPDVDSHWFANREPQAPGAMCKQERLPLCRGWGSYRTCHGIMRRQNCERPQYDRAQTA